LPFNFNKSSQFLGGGWVRQYTTALNLILYYADDDMFLYA